MRDRMTTKPTKKLGLRFNRNDATHLRELARRVRTAELHGHAHSTFDLAADAAETGEPLIVLVNDPMEAVLMAAGYTQWGIDAPTIEQLNT